MDIAIITMENRRLYPAIVYSVEDKELKNPILDINDIYELLYKNKNIVIVADQYDQYGNKLKIFNGQLEKNDIKALFAVNEEENNKDLNEIMTLSEAAEKWGLSNGSTIRKAIERGKFEQNEIKQAGNVWIITYAAMERIFGQIKNDENIFILGTELDLIKETSHYMEKIFYCNHDKIMKYEDKCELIPKILIDGLNAVRHNQKVIIKNGFNYQIKQIICNEDEYYSYIQSFYSMRGLIPKEKLKYLIDILNEI